MADVPVGAVPAPESPKPANGTVTVQSARAQKFATMRAGLQKLASEQAPTATAAVEAPAAPLTQAASEPAPQSPVDVKPEPSKDEPKVDDKPDAKTQKGLDAVEKAAKKFRDEQAAERRKLREEIELERAEIARMRAESKAAADTGDVVRLADLRKLAKEDSAALLAKLGIAEDEDAAERVGRGAFAFTKEGKKSPQHRENFEQRSELASLKAEIAEAKKALEEVRGEFKTRDQRAEAAAFVQRYGDEAVKAIPTEPTLIGKLHAKTPQKARQALLEVAARMEKENDGETPSHADVIAEYEKLRRAELEEQGVDVDALLKPVKAAPPAPSKTLDVATPNNGTRPINGNPTRAEKLAAVSVGLRKLHADQ